MTKKRKLLYLKTGTVHYERLPISQVYRTTMCQVPIDNEDEWTDDLTDRKRMCKRCRVAAGERGRTVYRYGPMAWKRLRHRI